MARIGVNALYLIPGGVGGTEIYLRELLAALARVDSENQYFIFTNRETGADLIPQQSNFFWKPQSVRAAFRLARIVWEQIALPIEAARCRLDVLFNPGFTTPLISPCPLVTTFHDLQHLRHPEYFRWFDLPFWRFLLWASAHRSKTLIAVSENTRADLLHFYRVPAARIVVALHGVNRDLLHLDRSRPEPFLLCVSTLHPHKNIERLIRAYARRPRAQKLVLAGMRGFQTNPIEKLVAELGVRDRVEITGWLPRHELLDLFGRAWAFVYPSTFEGFGMPVLEALAAGIPSACSDIPALREVAGSAALLFDPLNDDSVAAALDRISQDRELRCKLAQAGPERARMFTWERSAETTLKALGYIASRVPSSTFTGGL
ncbi:MAG: glycosyltransferase family 4 protein [Bryobacterales bacterium]|nr:glycosyltransferase family 4 protein [Bryobacterales bacterium]MBV9398630.1 glycosyltransferase family 4 protein [Bryobacterales bacterium]